jgi:hypothetical protein
MTIYDCRDPTASGAASPAGPVLVLPTTPVCWSLGRLLVLSPTCEVRGGFTEAAETKTTSAGVALQFHNLTMVAPLQASHLIMITLQQVFRKNLL